MKSINKGIQIAVLIQVAQATAVEPLLIQSCRSPKVTQSRHSARL